jgi:hypothetical protein
MDGKGPKCTSEQGSEEGLKEESGGRLQGRVFFGLKTRSLEGGDKQAEKGRGGRKFRTGGFPALVGGFGETTRWFKKKG